MDTGSPKGSLPSTAIIPPGLAIARAERDRARRVSTELRKTFEALAHEVEPEVMPDEEQVDPDPQASLHLASLGIELACKEKEAIRLERVVVAKERDVGILYPKAAGKRSRVLNRRYLSAGDDLWRYQKKKMRLDDPGVVRLLEPRGNGLSECLLSLYKKCDVLDKLRKRPSHWRKDAMTYYTGSGDHHGKLGRDVVWCHISGMWHPGDYIKTAHIVPFLDTEDIGKILFGNRAESLLRAGNALLLSNRIEKWFDTYHLVVVPVDTKETPIKRWRTDVISSDILNTEYGMGGTAEQLDGKELVFLNANRPVSRFLYFHFIMALVRIKDIGRHGWGDIWARYYEQRPFPTPGNYMRQSMLLALATHFETTDMRVVESWITDHGFDSPLKLTDEEATEAARRVHVAVEAAISHAEKQEILEVESLGDSSEESSDESSEGSSEEN